ncbi:MAG: carbonic anhydrase family protein [Chloroflexi bacterium]|nr:carbonic anhydrase family protein [Chloroflexota bacterium]
MPGPPTQRLSRRALLRGALVGGGGLAAAALLGCDDDGLDGGNGAMTSKTAEWAYEGARGPEHWAVLAEAYSDCGGRAQSPVDIAGHVEGALEPLVFSYATPANVARTSGPFIYADYPAGNTLVSAGHTYGLVQMHMHAPSEHTVAGEQFAAELHLVHADEAGALAVVGLLFALGEASEGIQAFLDAAPPSGETAEGVAIDPGTYVPADAACYRYDGSLTTPPCSEGVAWHVLRETRTVSQAQVDALVEIGGGPTNRPVQPLHGRAITLA